MFKEMFLSESDTQDLEKYIKKIQKSKAYAGETKFVDNVLMFKMKDTESALKLKKRINDIVDLDGVSAMGGGAGEDFLTQKIFGEKTPRVYIKFSDLGEYPEYKKIIDKYTSSVNESQNLKKGKKYKLCQKPHGALSSTQAFTVGNVYEILGHRGHLVEVMPDDKRYPVTISASYFCPEEIK